MKENYEIGEVCHRNDVVGLMVLGLIAFQHEYYAGALFPNKREKHGSLGYVLGEKSIKSAHYLNMVRAAFSTKRGTIVGFVCGLTQHLAKNIPYLEPLVQSFTTVQDYPLYISLYVKPEYRRRGIATGLFEIIEWQAKKQLIKTLFLLTDKDSVPGKTFLESYGFADTGLDLYPDRCVFMKLLQYD